MATDWQAHSAVAAWCGLGISLLALAASLGSAGFTALQTTLGRAITCEWTGYLCAPEQLFAHLWTLDLLAGIEQPASQIDPTLEPGGDAASSADPWEGFAAAFAPTSPRDPTTDRVRSEGCTSLDAASRAAAKDGEIAIMGTRWQVLPVTGPTPLGDRAIAGGVTRRRLLLEAQVDFPEHRAPLHATLSVLTSDGLRHFVNLDYLYDMTLPAGVTDAHLLCALPEYLPGRYTLKILATGGVGADTVQQQELALEVLPATEQKPEAP